jgi:hypothetical protein
MIIKALAALAALGLAAPAMGQPGPPPSGHGEGPGHPPGGPGMQVFLSPAGEPFRAPRDEPYPVAAWFAAADTDHDGALTLAEFTADFARFFERLDADRNGVVDGFEVADYENKIAPEVLPHMALANEEGGREGMGPPGGAERRGGGPPGGGPPGGGRGGGMGGMGGGHVRRGPAGVDGAGAYGILNLPEPVSGADQDFDGKVTRDEWLAAAKARFRMLDKNGDGRVTLAELPLTRVQRLATETPKAPKRGLFGRKSGPREM